jgi:hypothetical protein
MKPSTTTTAQRSSTSKTVFVGGATSTPDTAGLVARWRERAERCRYQAKRDPDTNRCEILSTRALAWELAADELEQESKP